MSTVDILRKYKTIAVVGLSPNRMRPSHGVSQYMQAQGYRIIPVNPGHSEILRTRHGRHNCESFDSARSR